MAKRRKKKTKTKMKNVGKSKGSEKKKEQMKKTEHSVAKLALRTGAHLVDMTKRSGA